jgi:hypothetical protein
LLNGCGIAFMQIKAGSAAPKPNEILGEEWDIGNIVLAVPYIFEQCQELETSLDARYQCLIPVCVCVYVCLFVLCDLEFFLHHNLLAVFNFTFLVSCFFIHLFLVWFSGYRVCSLTVCFICSAMITRMTLTIRKCAPAK